MRENSMKMNMLLSSIILICSSVAVAESKKGLFEENNGTFTKSILKGKTVHTTLYVANDEMALLDEKETYVTDRKKHVLGYQILKIAPKELNKKLSDESIPYMRVYYTSKIRSDRNRYISTGKIIVELDAGTSVDEFLQQQDLILVRTINAKLGVYLFTVENKENVIEISNRLNSLKEVKQATPEWIKPILFR